MNDQTPNTFADPIPPRETAVDVMTDNSESAPPDAVGKYRLLGELGRGGLGVVYRGYDPDLKRSVAVKVLLSGQWAGTAARERLRAEAEAVARLSHPNIVRVFEVGQDDGRPFLALELVNGPTLAAVLATAPLSPATAARLAADLTDAIAHAHQHGVIHRDLKPGNILLDGVTELGPEVGQTDSTRSAPGTRTFNPQVVDFGMAKLSESGSHLTRTGMVIGTPSYMAPEQADGGPTAADPSVDVYALGAILYECLTGRPPFQAATILDTLELVRTADAVPPRQLQPQVPRDLEVICLHCLEKSPARRYPSAAALLDDLQRFLDGRPITARPVGPAGRAVRWIRRNPSEAGLAALGAAAIVATIGGVTLHNMRLQRALGQVTIQEGEARTAHDRANANYRHARDTIERILDQLDGKEYVGVPKVGELRRRQQEEALSFSLAVAAQHGDSPEVQHDTARALLKAATYQRSLGREAEAEGNFQAAVTRLTALSDQYPEDLVFRRDRAAALLHLWPYHARAKNPAAAEQVIREVIALREQVLADPAGTTADRSELGLAQYNLGNLFVELGRSTDAVQAYQRAVDNNRTVLAADSVRREYRDRQAATLANLSMLAQQVPAMLAEAERYHDEAASLYAGLVRDDSTDLVTVHGLAVLRVNWAYVQIKRKQFDRALADLADTLRVVEPLRTREPNHSLLTDAAFRTYGVTANIHEARGNWAEAVPVWRRVIDTAPADSRTTYRLLLALAIARAGDHQAAIAEVEALVPGLPPTTPPQHWVHLATVVAVARAKAPASFADRYASLAARMLAKAKAASDPNTWPTDRLKLSFNPDLGPVFSHPEVRAAVGLPPR